MSMLILAYILCYAMVGSYSVLAQILTKWPKVIHVLKIKSLIFDVYNVIVTSLLFES